MTIQFLTTDQLLQIVGLHNQIKATGLLAGMPLTQAGLDWVNEELSAIEAELDRRQPEGEFQTLLDDQGQPVGFEPK